MNQQILTSKRIAKYLAVVLAEVALAVLIWALSSPDWVSFLTRIVVWGDSDMLDYQKFPSRTVSNAPPLFQFKEQLSTQMFQSIDYKAGDKNVHTNFDDFLRSTGTTSFIVIKDDAILYEKYFNGYQRDSMVTSFSMAKSFTSALVGIAIDEGFVKGVNDRIVDYLPELRGKGFDAMTVRHLLTMSSGIKYIENDQLLPPFHSWSDDSKTYYFPNLRQLALSVEPDGEPVGKYFHYNNYHPLLLGMILERATHRPVAEYLQEKIWKPLGMEYPASWSLDSQESGFEKMESGINGRAIDFARFGRLFLNNDTWNGKQLISEAWVKESTSPDRSDSRIWLSAPGFKTSGGYYKYMWWGKRKGDGTYDFIAAGHLGQRILVSPTDRVIIVRFGTQEEGVDSWDDVLEELVERLK